MTSERVPEESWLVLPTSEFVDFLKRAHAGEDPFLLVLECVANSESEDVPGFD